ncbi:unnamed protein product, partial [Allacma fusca]
KTKRSLKQYSV